MSTVVPVLKAKGVRMEMCPKCREPREMRVAVDRAIEPDDNSTERAVEITTLHCSACATFVRGVSRSGIGP
jgi:hypothetical protein